MTVVVADSSPLNYLVLIGSVDLLQQLYGGIIVPTEVTVELSHLGAPSDVRQWVQHLPTWVEVRQVPQPTDPTLSHLDAGEQAAITLAQREGALLLIDEALGRREASRRGIRNTGTLGVIRAAARKDLVDLSDALGRLVRTNYRISQALIDEVIADDLDRRTRAARNS